MATVVTICFSILDFDCQHLDSGYEVTLVTRAGPTADKTDNAKQGKEKELKSRENDKGGGSDVGMSLLSPASNQSDQRSASVRWFKETQSSKLRRYGGALYIWFHGIITRRSKKRCRHFMIDALTNGSYVVVGEPQVHKSLNHLVRFHSNPKNPISPFGDFLTTPCGQEDGECDYAELIDTDDCTSVSPSTSLPGSPSTIRTPSVGDKEQQQLLPQKQRTTQYGGITKSLPAESKSKAPPSEEQPSLVMKEDEYDLLCPQLPGISPAIRLTPSIDDEEQQRSLPPKQRTTQYGGIHKPLSSDSTSKTSSPPVTIEHEYAVLCPEIQGSPPASIGDEEEQRSLPPNQRTTHGGITRPLSSDPTSKAPSSKGQSSLVMEEDVYDVLRPQSPGSPSAIRLTPSIGDEQHLQRSPPPKQRTTQYGGITRPLSSDSTGRATSPVTNEHEYGVLCPPARA
ncbi:uncharacterized protein [Diadema antillarum]|uniref:uncharacterized protein n=1 Tax=Diadema antillarum TaxID=105358 RepID=UPI003A8C6627